MGVDFEPCRWRGKYDLLLWFERPTKPRRRLEDSFLPLVPAVKDDGPKSEAAGRKNGVDWIVTHAMFLRFDE